MHRAALIGLLEKIPAEKADFTAWEGGMSFTKLADHLSASAGRMGAMMRGTEFPKLEPSPNLASAIERLKSTHNEAATGLEVMPDEAFAKVIPAFGGREMPISALADFLVQHEAHHKGQVWLMARMIGIEPGMFVAM